MKRMIILSIFLLMPALAGATEPAPGKQYIASASVPTKIDKLIYITGIEKVDAIKIKDPKRIPRYKAWFDLDIKDASITRVDRGTLDGGDDDIEITVAYFKYADITELYYGHDAIKRAEEGLPTGLTKIKSWGSSVIFGRGPSYVSLPKYMRHRSKVPMIIFFKEGDKTISLVLRGSPAQMEKLYTILAKQAGLKVKPPQKYP